MPGLAVSLEVVRFASCYCAGATFLCTRLHRGFPLASLPPFWWSDCFFPPLLCARPALLLDCLTCPCPHCSHLISFCAACLLAAVCGPKPLQLRGRRFCLLTQVVTYGSPLWGVRGHGSTWSFVGATLEPVGHYSPCEPNSSFAELLTASR